MKFNDDLSVSIDQTEHDLIKDLIIAYGKNLDNTFDYGWITIAYLKGNNKDYFTPAFLQAVKTVFQICVNQDLINPSEMGYIYLIDEIDKIWNKFISFLKS